MNPKESAPKSKPTQEPDPSRFANFTVLEDESGFKIEGTDHIFLFDSEGGWFDEYGNYYNADAVPCTPPELSLEEEEITQDLEKKGQSKEEEKEVEHGDEEDWNDDEEEEEDQDTYSKAYQLYKQMGGKFAEDEEEVKVDTPSSTTKTSNQENRFEEFWPTDDKAGFHIDGTDHVFVFDSHEGWYDEKGNYFDADGVPKPAPEYKDKQLEKFLKDKASLEKFYVRNLKLKTSKKDFHTYLEKQKAGVDIYDIHFFNDEKNNFAGSALIGVKDGSKLLSLNGKGFSGAPLVIVKYV